MKILTICPSIHADKLSRMYNSYDVTTSKSNNLVVNQEKGSITSIINKVFNKYPDYDFYHVTNDDVIYETPLWDIALANKGKISYGNDAVPEGVDGQFLMIPGDFARALGWLQMPTLERYCGDVVWRFIGAQLGILNYVPDVKIRHYWKGADKEINDADMAKFAEWLPVSHKDIEKIRRLLWKKNKKYTSYSMVTMIFGINSQEQM